MHTNLQYDQQIYYGIYPSHNLVLQSPWWRNSHQVHAANWSLLHRKSLWEAQKIEVWKLHIWTIWWMLWHFPSISVKLQCGHLDCVGVSHFHRESATPASFFKQHLSAHLECCSSINCLISGNKLRPLKNSFVARVI
jgi:hypothetical protein